MEFLERFVEFSSGFRVSARSFRDLSNNLTASPISAHNAQGLTWSHSCPEDILAGSKHLSHSVFLQVKWGKPGDPKTVNEVTLLSDRKGVRQA